MQKQIDETLDSREVAEMVEKDHNKLLRDIRRYVGQLNEANIGSVDFFHESTYEDNKGEIRPCYRVTKKGCEFIAHKLTGTKGTVFTARYINRFHEMENALIQKKAPEPELPWFIRKFRGDYVMLFRDFKTITGVELMGEYTAFKRPDRLIGGVDCNGYGWKCDNEKFRKEYGFDFGENPCLDYLYLRGIVKALNLIERDGKAKAGSREIIMNGVRMLQPPKRKVQELQVQKPLVATGDCKDGSTIQINITFASNNRRAAGISRSVQ